MDTILARKMWATLEPYHAMIHFAPEAFAAWERLGFPHRGMGYFAARAAAMGRVDANVVTATFFNFHPGLVAKFIPAAWDIAEPEQVVEARYRAADQALTRLLDGNVGGNDMRWAGETAMEATTACRPEGRPLFAAHASVPAPEEPHLLLWHALTLLREYRGDAHVHLLVAAGLSGLEAVVSYAATGDMFDPTFYRRSRGYSEEEWADGEASLRERGWLDDSSNLTEAGRQGRAELEASTDSLSMDPWRAIGQEASDRLRETVRPWSRAIVAAGGLGGSPFFGR